MDELLECVCLQRLVDGTLCGVMNVDQWRGLFLSLPHLAFDEPRLERGNGPGFLGKG